MTSEVMIDIETIDVTPKAVVLSVASMMFNQKEGASLTSTYYKKLELQPQFDIGRTISERTIMWWMEQDAEVRNEAFGIQRFPVDKVLKGLAKNCAGARNIWANGPMFDIIILEDLARDFGVFSDLEEAWKFYQTRDLRTLKDEAGLDRTWAPESIPDKVNFGKHHPVTDCYIQIEALRAAREILPLAGM